MFKHNVWPNSKWGVLLVWLFTLPAITPLLQPNLAHTADGLLHLYRIVALDQAIGQGAFFPRWLPDLAYGYGLPLFVFYAPAAYYITLGIGLLGFPIVQTINLSLIIALFLAGTGTYLFVNRLFGLKAALVASVAYVYAPYLLTSLFLRGSLPLVWALALFPLVFWAFERLFQTKQWLDASLAAFLLGVALLTHNISTLLFLPLLAFFVAVRYLLPPLWTPSTSARGELLRSYFLSVAPILLALILGGGLALFFLLPAMIEKEFVQIERVITPPDFDY
ncbi:MAG: 6-pyruvoyl-tetrahydropterin synthase-related protein, partial [Chloroflexota bacterium]